MLENIANAIDFADEAYVANYPGDPLAARAGPKWSEAITVAVLRAMYEPSEAMYGAGYDATRDDSGMPQFADAGFCLGHSGKIWRAMVNAADKDVSA